MNCFSHLATHPLDLAMSRCSFESRDRIFVEGNGFSFLLKIWVKI